MNLLRCRTARQEESVMTRFVSVSEDEMLLFAQEPKGALNTQRVVKQSVTLFRQYLDDDPDFENFDTAKLCEKLKFFFASVRNRDGGQFKISSLRSLKYGLAKYIKDNCNVDIKSDSDFAEFRQVFASVCTQLKNQGIGLSEHTLPIADADIQYLYAKDNKIFDLNSPKGLQRKVWFDIVIHFFPSCKESLRSMKKLTFAIGVDSSKGLEYVYCVKDKNELDLRREQDASLAKELLQGCKRTTGAPVMYARPNDMFCPVSSFRRYIEKLHPKFDALWQCALSSNSLIRNSDIWYRSPIGKNSLAKMMLVISRKGELSRLYNNQSARTTTIDALNKALNITKRCSDRPMQLDLSEQVQQEIMEECESEASLNGEVSFRVNAALGRPSKLYDTNSEDWAPTVDMGHDKIHLMEDSVGKGSKKRKRKMSKYWLPPEESTLDYSNQALNGSMMIPRVIYDESNDMLTLSKYKNLLSYTVNVGQDGYCDIVPKLTENENCHLELVLMPKAYLNIAFPSKAKTPDNMVIKSEPEDSEYYQTADMLTGHIPEEPEMATESTGDLSQFTTGLSESVSDPNLGPYNLPQAGFSTFYEMNKDLFPENCQETKVQPKVIYVERTKANGSDENCQTMYIKQEPVEMEENVASTSQGNQFNSSPSPTPDSYKNKYTIINSGKASSTETKTKPNILQRHVAALPDDQLFKFFKTTLSWDWVGKEFSPWTVQIKHDYVLLNQMADLEFPAVARQVILNRDFTYKIKVHTMPLPDHHPIYNSHPKTLRVVNDFKDLLRDINKLITCAGNHDRRSNHFFLMYSDNNPTHPAVREGNFGGKCLHGDPYEWTIRSKLCYLLLSSYSDKCPECHMYYKMAKSAPVPEAEST